VFEPGRGDGGRAETPFLRIIETLFGGLLLADGIWIDVVTIDRDSGLDLLVGLVVGTVLALVGGVWILTVAARR
jgi:hypothetical protein